jgi:hypothetical protein
LLILHKEETGAEEFKKGERTPVNVKLGFKNFYLYTCASPVTGDEYIPANVVNPLRRKRNNTNNGSSRMA